MNLIIVRARPEQAQTLTQIAIAAKRHWNYPERWIEIWLPILTITPEHISKNTTRVAVKDEKPAGFYSLLYESNYASLEHMWVLPEYIGQGIGRLLLQHALDQCRQQSAKILKIESDPNAAGFYEKIGATKIGEHRGEVDGQPRILPIMEIRL